MNKHFSEPKSPIATRSYESRSIGFPKSKLPMLEAPERSLSSPVTTNAAQPNLHRAPPVKRAKGRWFIACILLSILGTIGFALWNEFLRFEAYGIIEGRVVRISAPWSGSIESLQVEDGERVEKGQVLATLDSPELRIRLAKIQDDLQLAHASIATRLAEIKSRNQEQALDNLKAHVDHFQILSQLHLERSRLSELNSTSDAIEQLGSGGIVSKLEAAQTLVAKKGQYDRVQSLEEAAQQLHDGLLKIERDPQDLRLLEADQVRLDGLKSEWKRLTDFQTQGEIRSPVAGRVMRRHRLAGECIEANTELFEVLEDHSMQAVVYVPQSLAGSFRSNDTFALQIPPYRQLTSFRVERLDDQTTPAPPNLSRYYRRDERLVAIIAKPSDKECVDTQGSQATWLGAEVRLPRWVWHHPPHHDEIN